MLTPTEQGGVSKALSEVIIARNSGNIDYYWRCLETFYFTCRGLKKCSGELQDKISPIFKELKKIKIINRTPAMVQRQANQRIFQYKNVNADSIFEIIMISLRDSGYGETTLGATPLNQNKPHMGMKTT